MNSKVINRMPIGKILGGKTLLAAVLFAVSAPALSAEYWLRAEAFSVTMPDGASVPMWGYAKCTADFICAAPTSPGPELTVPPNDTSGLTVHLRNTLPEPVSLVINGQITEMEPVWNDGNKGPRTNATQRVRSFTHEAVGTNLATYTWPIIKPGSYLYQSGTHPQVQVQMGLYGAMISDGSTAGSVSGVAYDKSLTLLFSEIDPALHTAVANGTYGVDANGISLGGPTSTLNYDPKYFLINGKTFTPGEPALATYTAGERVLMRFLNAGLRTRVPLISNGHLSVLAEDGNAYPWGANPRQQYTIFLPAAKTIDALFVAQVIAGEDATYAIYDRRLALNNSAAPDGGMMALIKVIKSTANPPPAIISPPPGVVLYAAAGTPFGFQVYASANGGGAPLATTLGLKSDAAKRKEKEHEKQKDKGVDTGSGSSSGSSAGTGTGTTVAAGGSGTVTAGSATEAITYELHKKPYGMDIGQDGSVSWIPDGNQVGNHEVEVSVTDSAGQNAVRTAKVVVAQNNVPPVAGNDSYTMMQDSTFSVVASGLLANDSDSDRGPLPLTAVDHSSLGGTVTGNPDGSFTYKAKPDFTGVTTFTYAAFDGVSKSAATVTIKVLANRAPKASADTVNAPVRSKSHGAYEPILINVLANDVDPDTEIDATNKIAPDTLKIVSEPSNGGTITVDKVTGVISYTPKANFKGTESFTYKVKDTSGATSNTVRVQVKVN